MCRFSFALAIWMGTVPALVAGPAAAETAAEFYSGKTIRWVIPYRPGGGFDEYSRLIRPHFEACSGAEVELVNLPGTGGLKGSVEVYRAPSDGLHVGLLNVSSLVALQLLDESNPVIDLDQYSYVGRVAAEETVLILSSESEISGIDDILSGTSEMLVGATGGGGSSYADALVPAEIFGLNQRLISGFDSSSDIRLALLRGDIDSSWGSSSTQLKLVRDGVGTAILRTGTGPSDGLEDVPSVYDYAVDLDPGARAILDAWVSMSETGRAVLAPPGVPEDRRAFLEDALDCALGNPEFLQAAAAAERTVAFLNGAGMREIVRRAVEADPETIGVLQAALSGN